MARFLSINLRLVANTLRNVYLIQVTFLSPCISPLAVGIIRVPNVLVLVQKQRRERSRDTAAEASEKLPDTLKRQIYRTAL